MALPMPAIGSMHVCRCVSMKLRSMLGPGMERLGWQERHSGA